MGADGWIASRLLTLAKGATTAVLLLALRLDFEAWPRSTDRVLLLGRCRSNSRNVNAVFKGLKGVESRDSAEWTLWRWSAASELKID